MNTRASMLSTHKLPGLRKLRWAIALLAIAPLGVLVASVVWGADQGAAPAPIEDSGSSTVEMFAAMKSGEVDVKFIAKDDRAATVTIKNKTRRPLTVQLPAKFAAVPVLAQRGGAGGMMGGGGMGGGMNQGMGGGMGGGMMGGGGGMMGGGGMGGGMFNVPAEVVDDVKTARIPADKAITFKVATVCLDYGKRDPRPSIPYEMRPLESYTTKPGVAELLILLGNGRINQRSAQAAAWHLANDVSWDHLAGKRIETIVGDGGPYFSTDQIAGGLQVAEVSLTVASKQAATQLPVDKSPGDKAPSAQPAANAAGAADDSKPARKARQR